jgi:hypothetical protein
MNQPAQSTSSLLPYVVANAAWQPPNLPLSILYPSSIHPLSILYPSSIHPLSILYPSSIHPLSTLYPSFVHPSSILRPSFAHPSPILYPPYQAPIPPASAPLSLAYGSQRTHPPSPNRIMREPFRSPNGLPMLSQHTPNAPASPNHPTYSTITPNRRSHRSSSIVYRPSSIVCYRPPSPPHAP